MRELTDFELALVSGGYGCEEASGEEINICGYPPPDPPSYPPSPPPPGSYEPPVGSPPSSGGGGTGGGSATPVGDHPKDCGSQAGAAVGIANHVMGIAAGSGPPSPLETATGKTWQDVEFTAIIVRNADGSYGALNDKIYSDDSASMA